MSPAHESFMRAWQKDYLNIISEIEQKETTMTAPTPHNPVETIAFNKTVTGTPLERYWSAISHAEKLERERDGARQVAKELASALNEDALWGFNGDHIPQELKVSYVPGIGSMTNGPNNCKSFYLARKKALAAYKVLTPSKT